MSNVLFESPRPRPVADVSAFEVRDQMVLLGESDRRLVALNETGRVVWELCNGMRCLDEIRGELGTRFEDPDSRIDRDVTNLVLGLVRLGFLELESSAGSGRTRGPSAGPRVRLLYGVEDTVTFHWQLGILFESLVGQLPEGWGILVVVCNEGRALSGRMASLFEIYGVEWASGERPGRRIMDWAGGGDPYVALNRIEALNVAADRMEPDELVCLMDTDTFLFGDLDESVFPEGNAVAANWLVGRERFFPTRSGGRGVDLERLLEALGCTTPWQPGAVTVFLSGAALRTTGLVRDCFRFAQLLYLAGRLADHTPRDVWVAEMAAYALAMTNLGIEYEVLEDPQFVVPVNRREEPPPGTFYHYYAAHGRDGGAFPGSRWHKQLFHDRDFLGEDLESFQASADSAVETRFFELARRARRRLEGHHES